MVELRLLAFLLLRSVIHWEADGVFEGLQTELVVRREGRSTVLRYHANTINGGLSDGAELGGRVLAYHLHDVGVDGTQKVRAEILNHVI